MDENQYIELVRILYNKIKELREEFRRSEREELWSNINITIYGIQFKVEYDYTNLSNSSFNSYERHVIWRYENLKIGPDQVSKEDKEILKRYLLGPKVLTKKEHYETGIYIQDIENRIEYPVIVKPCDGSGSKAVNKVEEKEELKVACEKALESSLSKKVLIETFISGKEYGVESFVYNNEINVLGIMEKIMTKEPIYAELGHSVSNNLNKELENRITDVVKKAIECLQINFGSVNMDILVTNKNKVCIVDIGARMGGNLIGSHIIPIATGIDYMGNIIKASLNEDVVFNKRENNVVATRIMNFRPGTVKKLPDLIKYMEDSDVKDIVCKLRKGDKINIYKNNLDGCGYVVVSNPDITISKEKALIIKDKIDNEIERTEDNERV